MEIKRLLKYFAKHGYPGPDTLKMMEYMGYDDEEFLHDLVEELGQEGAMEFVSKTFGKLSSTSEISIKVDLSNVMGDGSWVYLDIYRFFIDLDEEYSDVLIHYGWGDSFIIDPIDGSETTIEQMSDEVDMGEMGEWEDFMDSIRSECYTHIKSYCGFGIWYT